MAGVLEQLVGAALIAVVLADVFLNVLYARAGIAILSRPLAHGLRWAFVKAARFCGSERTRVLSFCGPAIVVALLVMWMVLLLLGAAMVIHPMLGGAIRAATGPTSRDFTDAIYVAAGVISSAGAGTVSPHTPLSRLFIAFCSFLGIAVMTLVITYLMQLYTALQRRDALALKIELMTGQTGDAARLVAGLGPEGRFETGYTVLTDLAAELSQVKEAHHLYPILFYFRFPQPFYELSRFTLVVLDAVDIIHAALDDAEAGWLKRSAALEHLQRAGLVLIETLHRIYLQGSGAGPEEPQPGEAAAWRARFLKAVATLRAAGVPTRRDLARCAEAYVQRRNVWNDPLMRLGGVLGHRPSEIDPALHPEAPAPPPRTAPAAAPRVLH
jgi:hypothetical protein